MDGYILDLNYPDEALDIVLSSPKRRTRPLGPDSSFSSSIRTPSSVRRRYDPRFSDSLSQDPDYSVDLDFDLADVFSTPGRRSHVSRDLGNSSPLSWDITPSLTFDKEVDVNEEMDKSQVEELVELVDTEMGGVEGGDGLDWHEMASDSCNTPFQVSNTLELDANLVLEQLSGIYPHVLAGATSFKPLKEHGNKEF
ncbi:hypothetical protein FRC07_013542, partial [Ceratobasidium sp. 392]